MKWIESLIWKLGRCAPNGVGMGLPARRNRITGKVQMFLETQDRWVDFHKFHYKFFKRQQVKGRLKWKLKTFIKTLRGMLLTKYLNRVNH